MPVKKSDPNDERIAWKDTDLMTTRFKPPEWIIPNYLPNGLIMLVGRPFSGKSFLSLQVTNTVNRGSTFFGEQAKKGKCLYLALEDSNVDLQGRMRAIGWQPTGNVDFFTEWPRFAKGGMDKLRKQLESGEYIFCVIDSLYKLLSGSKTQRDGEMEPVMTELHSFCKHRMVDAIMPLYHSNKLSISTGEGNESAITGDTSVAGVADSFWLLYRKPQNKQVYFHAEGRKMRRIDIPVQFVDKSCTWRMSTPLDSIKPDSIKGLILTRMKAQSIPMSATQLSKSLGKSLALVTRELGLLEDGDLKLVNRLPRSGVEVFYELPKMEKDAFDFLKNGSLND